MLALGGIAAGTAAAIGGILWLVNTFVTMQQQADLAKKQHGYSKEQILLQGELSEKAAAKKKKSMRVAEQRASNRKGQAEARTKEAGAATSRVQSARQRNASIMSAMMQAMGAGGGQSASDTGSSAMSGMSPQDMQALMSRASAPPRSMASMIRRSGIDPSLFG